VPANILAKDNQFSIGVKQRRRVQASGAAKDCLVRPQNLRQLTQNLRIDSEIGIWLSQPAPANCFNRSLPANPATRRSEEVSLQIVQFERSVL
jgi:hypothetical protein